MYYDGQAFTEAISLIQTDPYKALDKLKKYFDKYPLDYSSYPYYISTLMLVGEFDIAEEKLNYIQNKYDSGIFKNDERKDAILRYSIIYARFKLLCYQGKYEEAYNYYYDNINSIKKFDVDKILFYCRMKMGLVEDNIIKERDVLPYFYRQTIDYKESDFIHHAKKHCADNPHKNEDEETEFVSGFPFEEVLSEIKKYIPSEKKLYPGFIDNMYVFRYDECGTSKKGPVDYIKVFTFNDTNDFITMYPCKDVERLPYVDLNYMRKVNNTKVKRRSQIDKFNDRFGIK